MCFSVVVDTNIKKLSLRFKAKPLQSAFNNIEDLLALQGLEDGPQEIKKLFNLKRLNKNFIKIPSADGRIYPNYFANVIVQKKDGSGCLIVPMRYRVRPSGSAQEIPSKYNLFNARLDSLESRRTWKKIFMRRHGLFPFQSFYEWVEDKRAGRAAKPRLIRFMPKDRELMWAPCLYDVWESIPEKKGAPVASFYSFALITDEPPSEVAAQGHDRCPVFLKEEHISDWLYPKGLSKQAVYDLLKSAREEVYYEHKWPVAA